jgi:ABC-type polysaccharide/polyol phosphate transport system ATPase subunit
MTPVICVEHLSKHYVKNQYRPSLRHEGVQIIQRALRLKTDAVWKQEPFWALRDVNFAIEQGETVGIIGRNGSGKTTLLRILSGITDPSEGIAEVHGRFATLIGVSAAFDFERTGLENIYFNAAIYGVPPKETERILDDIIAFSELEEFLDTPVKRYSSGMIARLGFSIAIHILPEIIFIDEVLAVGDAAFQQKCIARVMDLKERGCTIMFVSHSTDSILRLCDRCIWLDHGRLMMDGATNEVLQQYKAFTQKS